MSPIKAILLTILFWIGFATFIWLLTCHTMYAIGLAGLGVVFIISVLIYNTLRDNE